jgi:hypothetical protein
VVGGRLGLGMKWYLGIMKRKKKNIEMEGGWD